MVGVELWRGIGAGSISSSSSSDSSISSISSSYSLTRGGGLCGMRSKSTNARVSPKGGNRTPNTSGTGGSGIEFVCIANESICCNRDGIKSREPDVDERAYFFCHPATKLPPDSRLHGQDNVLHLYLALPSSMVRIHLGVLQDLSGVAVGE